MAPADVDVAEWFARVYGDRNARVLRSHQRTSGRLFMLEGPGGTSWLRIGGVMRRGLDAVEAEGCAVSDLAASNVPVAKPRKRRDGRFASYFGLDGTDQPAIAYEHLAGTESTEPSASQAEALGEMIAALHAAQTNCVSLPATEPITEAVSNVACCLPWLAERDARWLWQSVERVLAKVAQHDAGTRPTICHGDLRLGNVSFVGDQPTLFDFEALSNGPACYDLACLWRRRVIECGMTESIPDWVSFLRGYERAHPIDDRDLHFVKLLAMLRAVWTMALPAQPGVTWGTDWVHDPDYWRDHMKMVRWFARAADDASDVD